jgi:hypothetical protein
MDAATLESTRNPIPGYNHRLRTRPHKRRRHAQRNSRHRLNGSLPPRADPNDTSGSDQTGLGCWCSVSSDPPSTTQPNPSHPHQTPNNSHLSSPPSGLVIPQINTPSEALAAVRSIKFLPLGFRGQGSPFPAIAHGVDLPTYIKTANETIITCLQIESKAGVEIVDAICCCAWSRLVVASSFSSRR